MYCNVTAWRVLLTAICSLPMIQCFSCANIIVVGPDTTLGTLVNYTCSAGKMIANSSLPFIVGECKEDGWEFDSPEFPKCVVTECLNPYDYLTKGKHRVVRVSKSLRLLNKR